MLLSRRRSRSRTESRSRDEARSGSRSRSWSWQRWRRWRRSRPFWGGLLTLLSGAWICVLPLAPLKIMLQQGVAGIPSVLMGAVLIVLGLTGWFAPPQRVLAGILTTLIATAALVLSNLGGFLIGTLLGIFGGGLMFAWQPYADRRAGNRTTENRIAGGSASPPADGEPRTPTPTPTPHHDPQGAQP
ncbi:DUF6114 domain-containing protein [Streptomyces sp. CB03578]|uniref:DUF6114 domain-containing protein n=1 Tax=Streptomyces sp. CB03578 TaxID=1718987 RepID=UPI001F521316|nr:DUF6114 domain-containing protein [Streptomyces sp. CB03578]